MIARLSRWLLGSLLVLSATVACAESRPNIVLVMTDDLNTRLLDYLPELRRLLRRDSMELSLTVPTPVCAPSRATILTGKYAHNHRVLSNGAWSGGVAKFKKAGNEQQTVAVWLQAAGYTTGFFGKYLNGYGVKRQSYVPVGWDRWVSFSPTSMDRHNLHTIEDGGQTRSFENTYDVDFTAHETAEFIARARAPFFAVWAPMSPHGPFIPARRHRSLFATLKLDPPPSFSGDAEEVTTLTRKRLKMMIAVQEGFAGILRAIARRGLLGETYVFFTSDNGLFMGEHGLGAGKGQPWEEATQVALYVRGPGVPVGARDDLLFNGDLAPTFAELAGLEVPQGVDARSFAPLLRGEELSPRRERALLEGWLFDGRLAWRGLRTRQEKIVQQPDGSCQKYRLASDPYEMQPLECHPDDVAQIERLAVCTGQACRDIENEPPRGAPAVCAVRAMHPPLACVPLPILPALPPIVGGATLS